MSTLKREARIIREQVKVDNYPSCWWNVFEDEEGNLYDYAHSYLTKDDIQGRYKDKVYAVRRLPINGIWIFEVYPIDITKTSLNVRYPSQGNTYSTWMGNSRYVVIKR